MLDRFKDAKWYIDHGTGVYGTLACGHPTIVADTAGHSCSRTGRQEDQEANARLIASAPDLLSALIQLMEWEGDEAGFYPEDDTQQRANEVWQDAFDAIARAKGEVTND